MSSRRLSLAPFALRRRPERGGPTFALAGNGVILAVHWVAFFAAIQVSTVAIGLLGFASFPLFVIVLERLLLGVRWRGPEIVTAVLVVAGLALLVPAFALADRTVQGLAWGVLSGFTFAWLTVRNRALGSARRADGGGAVAERLRGALHRTAGLSAGRTGRRPDADDRWR